MRSGDVRDRRLNVARAEATWRLNAVKAELKVGPLRTILSIA